jgi:putative hemolysin
MFATKQHYPVSSECLPPVDRVTGTYRLRFGHNSKDLMAVQRLRFEVFNRELGEGLAASWKTGLDADPWDELFHHIVIEHVPTSEVVGSYRLQTGEMAERHGGFYSDAEFDLRQFSREMLLDAVEIGRACVHAAHRNGRVIHLLWKGLAAYLLWNDKRYLFGCCSILGQDPAVAAAAWWQLKAEGFVSDRYSAAPQRGLACDVRRASAANVDSNALPPLFQSYLNLGAEVCGPPALDTEFGTIDFLVLLDLARLDERTREKFFRDLPSPAIPRIA